MAKFKIEEVREIIRGYTFETYFVEAKSEEEARRMVEEREVDPEQWNCEILEATFESMEVNEINPIKT